MQDFRTLPYGKTMEDMPEDKLRERIQLGMDFGDLEWLPPCPACNSIVEGFRILKDSK